MKNHKRIKECFGDFENIKLTINQNMNEYTFYQDHKGTIW